MSNKTISISLKKIYIFSLMYLSFPIMMFLFFWTRTYIGVFCCLSLCFSIYKFIKNIEKTHIKIELIDLIASIFIIIIYCILCGQGGFFLQSWDNHTKNAIFRDLITHEWPVFYTETGNTLIYYFSYWLIPAFIGKFSDMIGFHYWKIANVFLLIWTSVGVFLTCFFVYANKKNSCKFIIFVFLFFIFGGLNWGGNIVSNIFDLSMNTINLNGQEGWLDGNINGYDSSYLYRSFYDALTQSYNQSIPTYLVTSIIFFKRKISYFVLFGTLLIPYAPLPLIGLFLVLLLYILYILLTNKINFLFFLKQCFSLENLMIILAILPVFALFYSCNNSSNISWYTPCHAWTTKRLIELIIFYFFEFGVFVFVLLFERRFDVLVFCSVISLLFIPLIKVGNGRDFCMNASFSSIFMIFISITNFFSHKQPNKISLIVIIFCLYLSHLTPLLNILSNVKDILSGQLVSHYADNVYTLSDKTIEQKHKDCEIENYLCTSPHNKKFYLYISKKLIY